MLHATMNQRPPMIDFTAEADRSVRLTRLDVVHMIIESIRRDGPLTDRNTDAHAFQRLMVLAREADRITGFCEEISEGFRQTADLYEVREIYDEFRQPADLYGARP